MRLALVIAAALLAVGCTTTDGTSAGDKTLAAPSSTTAAAAPVGPEYVEPISSHFLLTVKTLDKECFGSAGCNVTFRVDLAYIGPTLDPDKTYEVTYEIRGGEDPMIGTLEVTGDSYERPEEELASTSSSRKVLRAVVTAVGEA